MIYNSFRDNVLYGYDDDPDYETISDRLMERWYDNLPVETRYYNNMHTWFNIWVRSELHNAETRSWLIEGADADYYAARDRREQEIMQLLDTPYDYYLTLLNNDTEYYKEWSISMKCITEIEET